MAARHWFWISATMAATVGGACAQSADVKTFTIKRGQKVVVMHAHFYEPGGCKPQPPQIPQVWAQPKIGSVKTEVIENATLPAGPCQGKPGTLARTIFDAGNVVGEDSFQLMVPGGYSHTGQQSAITYKYKVQ